MTQALIEHKKIPNVPYGSQASYNEEFGGRTFTQLGVKIAGTITADGTGVSTVFGDPTLRLLGEQFELVQAENPLVKADPRDLYWLASIIEGKPGLYQEDASIAASGTGDVYASFLLDFARMFGPRCMVDANDTKVHTRGVFGAPTTKYSPNAASFAGTLRQRIVTTQRSPAGGYLQPRIRAEEKLLESASADSPHPINFEQTTFCPGVLVRAHDNSQDQGTATGGSAYRPDSLIKAVTVDLETRDVNSEVHRFTWQELKDLTYRGWASGDIPTGYVWVPFTNRRDSTAKGAYRFEAGDVVRLHFDTLDANIEEEFGTPTTPSTGDKAVILVCGCVPRNMSDSDTRSPQAAARARSFVRRGGSPARARRFLD